MRGGTPPGACPHCAGALYAGWGGEWECLWCGTIVYPPDPPPYDPPALPPATLGRPRGPCADMPLRARKRRDMARYRARQRDRAVGE